MSTEGKKSKETENYSHYDLADTLDGIDKESLQTVCFENGVKLVIGRDINTNQIKGLKFLVPQAKNEKETK